MIVYATAYLFAMLGIAVTTFISATCDGSRRVGAGSSQ